MVVELLLTLALAGGSQVQARTPSPPDITAIVERAVRLSELQRRKIEVEGQLVASRQQYGENHPEMAVLLAQLAEVDSALLREGFAARQVDAVRLENRRIALDSEIVKLLKTLGPNHPAVRTKQTEVAALNEQLRSAAVTALASGMERELRTGITNAPASIGAYLDLAKLYATAGRPADAERLLTEAIAQLRKSSGGR